MKVQFYLIITAFGLISCGGKYSVSQIAGKWQAVQLVENDSIITAPELSLIQIEFNSNKTYNFKGTLNAAEKGTFKFRDDLLVRTDETTKIEKAVRIRQLDNELLIIEMKEGDKFRELTLKKM